MSDDAFEKWFDESFECKDAAQWFTEFEKEDIKNVWEEGREQGRRDVLAKWPDYKTMRIKLVPEMAGARSDYGDAYLLGCEDAYNLLRERLGLE